MSVNTRPVRMTADQRRAAILQAAMEEFAVGGLHGTSTDAIARRVGVSQPYLFRLFGTKIDLFLAVVNAAFDDVERVMEEGASGYVGDGEILEAMGLTYLQAIANRPSLMLQLQIYAACGEPQVRELVRHRYVQLYRLVQQVSGAGNEAVREFFASGMLLNVVAAMGVPAEFSEDEWFSKCLARME